MHWIVGLRKFRVCETQAINSTFLPLYHSYSSIVGSKVGKTGLFRRLAGLSYVGEKAQTTSSVGVGLR